MASEHVLSKAYAHKLGYSYSLRLLENILTHLKHCAYVAALLATVGRTEKEEGGEFRKHMGDFIAWARTNRS